MCGIHFPLARKLWALSHRPALSVPLRVLDTLKTLAQARKEYEPFPHPLLQWRDPNVHNHPSSLKSTCLVFAGHPPLVPTDIVALSRRIQDRTVVKDRAVVRDMAYKQDEALSCYGSGCSCSTEDVASVNSMGQIMQQAFAKWRMPQATLGIVGLPINVLRTAQHVGIGLDIWKSKHPCEACAPSLQCDDDPQATR